MVNSYTKKQSFKSDKTRRKREGALALFSNILAEALIFKKYGLQNNQIYQWKRSRSKLEQLAATPDRTRDQIGCRDYNVTKITTQEGGKVRFEEVEW